MLPAQNKSYNGAIKVVALLPFLIVVAALIAAAVLGWSYTHGSDHGMLVDAMLTSAPITSDQLASRLEGNLTYPGATDVKRANGTLASLAGQNPITAVMVPQILSTAQDMAGLPMVYTTFLTADESNTVLTWYDGQLQGRGWCSPAAANTNAGIRVYIRQQREVFAIITIPLPPTAATSSGTSMLTWYTAFPTSDHVPAC